MKPEQSTHLNRTPINTRIFNPNARTGWLTEALLAIGVTAGGNTPLLDRQWHPEAIMASQVKPDAG